MVQGLCPLSRSPADGGGGEEGHATVWRALCTPKCLSAPPPSHTRDVWTVPAGASVALRREPRAENLEIWVLVPGRFHRTYVTPPSPQKDNFSGPLFLRVHI